MKAIRKIKSLIPSAETDPMETFECQECGNVFESAKSPERVKCMECLSTDVDRR